MLQEIPPSLQRASPILLDGWDLLQHGLSVPRISYLQASYYDYQEKSQSCQTKTHLAKNHFLKHVAKYFYS